MIPAARDESTGGRPALAGALDREQLGTATGYRTTRLCRSAAEAEQARPELSGAAPQVFGTGRLPEVAGIVATHGTGRVLLVGSDAAVRRSGIERFLPAGTRRFNGFSPNPRLQDVLDGCDLVARYQPDVVVGVGGGSAMDAAKLARVLPPGDAGRHAVLHSDVGLLRTDAPALVLVPTVSGSGSEVTRFATVYDDGRKYSVDHARVLSTVSIVDPDLAATCPPAVAFSCVLDALAHAVESYWSLRSTADSRALAGEALVTLRQIAAGGRRRLDSAARVHIALSAIRAGRAIDVTRTTAAHAFAYPTTVRFGVPHGLACGLHLIWLLDHVASLVETDCVDPRGAEFVTARLDEIASLLGVEHPKESAHALESLVAAAGFATRLGMYGVTGADTAAIVGDGLGSVRAGNLPVRLPPDAALTALRDRL
ncbi:iron-containing alcohol dehydrogenase [Kitasatospora sp. NBC_01266]|uniref:iron-containing alcohol dehydrogenase n=1 Tax=Kitasatospora sp. NBC_01266 TaxID=2903572 RepID=UPI002E352C9A|nr:iron-containing alcohol dehydrogenase [Kitasatospora sp. NBC_01266]